MAFIKIYDDFDDIFLGEFVSVSASYSSFDF